MRSRTKWRISSGRDRVKEASRKLKVILKNSRKLSVTPEDLTGLKGTGRLRTACSEGHDPGNWLFVGILIIGVLVSCLLLLLVRGGLQDTLSCPNNTTKDIQIQTIRLERLPLDGPLDQPDDPTLFNESEDADDGNLRNPSHLRLRRGR